MILSHRKIPWNSPLNEKEKGQISAYQLKEKFINFIARELSRLRTVVRNYLKGPESYSTRIRPGVRHKLQMQPDVDFVKKLLKDNQAQEICKNLRIYLSLQEEFVNFSMNRQMSYTETGWQALL